MNGQQKEPFLKVSMKEFSELHYKIGYATQGLKSILFYLERLQRPVDDCEAVKYDNINQELNRMIKRMESNG